MFAPFAQQAAPLPPHTRAALDTLRADFSALREVGPAHLAGELGGVVGVAIHVAPASGLAAAPARWTVTTPTAFSPVSTTTTLLDEANPNTPLEVAALLLRMRPPRAIELAFEALHAEIPLAWRGYVDLHMGARFLLCADHTGMLYRVSAHVPPPAPYARAALPSAMDVVDGVPVFKLEAVLDPRDPLRDVVMLVGGNGPEGAAAVIARMRSVIGSFVYTDDARDLIVDEMDIDPEEEEEEEAPAEPVRAPDRDSDVQMLDAAYADAMDSNFDETMY
jgi:hypothetical protein